MQTCEPLIGIHKMSINNEIISFAGIHQYNESSVQGLHDYIVISRM